MVREGRQAELKAFLRAMRARRKREHVGLPPLEGRRRTPGLRIEEAAAIADVSLTWYSALEAGKNIRVSDTLLDRVARALGLNEDEHDYLFALAAPPERVARNAAADPTLQTVVDGFSTGPAFVSDRFWTVREYNGVADLVYGFSSAAEKNLLVRMLVDPAMRALHEDWERLARQMVGVFHFAFGQTPNEPDVVDLIARLNTSSPEFSRWWNDYGLRRYRPTAAVLHHPALGRLVLTFTSFIASANSGTDHDVIVLQPAADAETLERFRQLLER